MTDALNTALQAVQQIATRPLLICIDGPAGSGKTTLAEQLAHHYVDVHVVHMDDLYTGWNQPLNPELVERVLTKVVTPFHERRPLVFECWDWTANQWGATVELPASDIVILEGVGSAARELREHAQLTIFIDIDDAEGVKRVRTRDGLEVAAHMQSWIHHQQKYFESDETRTSCDIFIASNV